MLCNKTEDIEVEVIMIYFESDYLIVSWDSEIQAVIASWNGYLGVSDKVRTGHAKVIELVMQYKADKWISDLRNCKVVDQVDQHWIATELTSLLFKAGIRFTAMVIPTSPTAQLSLKSVVRNLKEGEITRGIFTSLEEARDWLR
jgi:hypothetical protein